jgi:uncharacterized iron-regulated membrane protein
MHEFEDNARSEWQRWMETPENLWVRRLIFQTHLWVGAIVGAYITIMSVSGSIAVFRNQLAGRFGIEWLVDLHDNLLSGEVGRFVNGIGALCLTLLCLTGAIVWWPGIKHWHRSLTVNWKAHFARLMWDLHSALGFWCFLFVLLWGISGIYFAFPQTFNAVLGLFDPRDKFSDQGLLWLSDLHFGRFGWFAETLWALLGLVPAALSITGVFLCCRRMIYATSSPREQTPNGRSIWPGHKKAE